MNPVPCRSCGALILWTVTEKGARMPVDAESSPAGNIDLLCPIGKPMVAIYLRKDEIAARSAAAIERGGTPPALRTSHFASCPYAEFHRKKPAAQAQKGTP